MPGKKFLVTLVITQLEMRHLVKCAPLVMSVHFKIRLSGVKKLNCISDVTHFQNVLFCSVIHLPVCPLLVSQLVTHNIIT